MISVVTSYQYPGMGSKDVYLRLSDGSGDMGGEVVLLQRAVYGLRQAVRQ